MPAPLAKFVDWYATQYIWTFKRTRALLKSTSGQTLDPKQSKLDEAVEFLNGPDFIPVETKPSQLEFHGQKHFTFPTPRPCDAVENNTVHGRLYRCGEKWQERPVIILLHGGTDFFNHHYRFPWMAPACNRAGFNAATLVAPYHFQRHARQLTDRSYLRLAHSFSQAVAEIRALTGWFLAQGCPAVTLWGISLGGWYAGLSACRDTRIASVVMAVPGVRPDYIFTRAEHIIWPGIKQALQAQAPARLALSTTPLNLTTWKPVIPKENILIVEGKYDYFVEADAIEELWQKWSQPEIWRLPHGHVSWMLTPGINGRILDWLASRSVSRL
ncbi:MAG TPA: alpha/beta hydrolase family protein [Verrucomicrobiae bacterium]|jgi:pimeloyl-ACP methyl ester carboxylesterase|nr:alpha/beta hydrolase family protein [Verrucomicrobiae bacterium]